MPVTGGFDGDEKSISVPSLACPCAPFPAVPRDGLRFALRLRVSSKVGICLGGESGILGFRMDLRGTAAVD